MKTALMSAILAVVLTISQTALCAEPNDANSVSAKKKKPLIQMAILLDTSGSMDGLINQARSELWSIVNEFIQAKKDGTAPEFQLALYEYGKDSLPQKKGYIRQILPFTTDLDKVSEELFALTTNGGSEYCGWVIKDAAEQLNWSNSDDDLKVIFIAGNEEFAQGPIKFQDSCKQAIARGIMVNTIHCGSEADGVNGKWKDGAVLADGKFLNIDQNRHVVHVAAPQDAEIAQLSTKLNDTYIPYGAEGKHLASRQMEQDKNAAAMSPQSTVGRAVSKSSSFYENSSWDLVDAMNNKKFDVNKLEKDQLPENMRSMSVNEREEYVKDKAEQRQEIQNKIQQLDSQRKQFVAAEIKKHNSDPDTLGSAMVQTVTEQAQKRNFTFAKQKPAAQK